MRQSVVPSRHPGSRDVFDPRITERRNPRSADIDLASPLAIVDLMNAEDRSVADAVATQREAIAEAIAVVEAVFRGGGRLFYVGAGTSGRLGILDASECPPTFGSDPELVQGIIAGGRAAVFRSQEGAEDKPETGAAALQEHGVTSRDAVVGIAASGTTPFVRGALAHARTLGARTVVIVCTPPDDELLGTVDIAIVPVTGPEVVTGSTRLKAGTATKMVLNMITTGAMIRLGKTYGNLMVDLQATNLKLKDRSERILVEVCDITRDDARRLLSSAGGRVKTAIVMQKLDVSKQEAERKLEEAGGLIRRVVAGPPPAAAIDESPVSL
jgi:N-acetylmuramic acid 6-phosphate etherase